MRHSKIKTGVEYAVNTGYYGKRELGDPDLSRILIIDTDKVWYSNTSMADSGRDGTPARWTRIAPPFEREPAMLGRYAGVRHDESTEILVHPLDILGLWSEHLPALARREALDKERTERMDEARNRTQQLANRAILLNVPGGFAHPTGGPWSLSQDQFSALLDRLEAGAS